MLVKRATAKLLAAGIEHIEIHKGLYGYTPYDPRLTRQTSITHNTAGEAVQAVLDGMRPRYWPKEGEANETIPNLGF